ncbi:hypothetical protein CTAYLR_002579 [Chrysophaeum taylorii]|uniref:Cilia- and flagella-associated protein 45 n=1 Tax=Chrysophaeum taylorii TaxID=2483200 RepID=A0AAD7UD25_9STRA|nr:hypothetical protein CTAYLR_002579 [Chrysophaeum taylorii]
MGGGYRGRESGADESLFESTRRRLPGNAAVISQAELSRMREASKVWFGTEEEQGLEKSEKERLARERKSRMLALEAKAKSKARKSELEVDRERRKATICELAKEARDENLDMVKMLNTLGARAAAFTIRDQQLVEKKALEAKRKEYEDRMEVLMEIDRLSDLEKREKIEKERRSKRIEDRKVIIEQIEARQKQKLLEEEQREQDNVTMLALVAKYEAEDAAAKEKRDEEVRQARKEVLEANEAAIKRKELAKQRERDEEASILLYQARKDEELRAREQAEKQLEAATKERQAKLLAAQEKTQSTQDEIDEIRARRWAEERERKERENEARAAQAKAARVKGLRDAHKHQTAQKKTLLAREAVLQKEEYEATLRHARAIVDDEKAKESDKARKAIEHRAVLQHQIEEARDAKHKQLREKREEGIKLKLEFSAERAKLEAIRDKMVNDMEKKGYNSTYLAEIRSADIEKLQNR